MYVLGLESCGEWRTGLECSDPGAYVRRWVQPSDAPSADNEWQPGSFTDALTSSLATL